VRVKPRRHYAHAPITEAVIDVQVDLPSSFELGQLEEIHLSVASRYPGKRKNIEVRGEFTGGTQVGATATQTLKGFSFSSADGKQVVQVRRDGFTFSRLSPYETWERLCAEAKRLWEFYRAVVKPTQMTRVAVRYINQINIPLPMRDFGDYLRTIPQVSPDLEQGLSTFFMRLEQPQADIGAHLVLTEAMIPTTAMDICPVVLDIDVFGQGLKLSADKEVWDLLELLRDRKNDVFESCITDATRSLIS
jgi:uncharacterized protein (TIGR04255 family)